MSIVPSEYWTLCHGRTFEASHTRSYGTSHQTVHHRSCRLMPGSGNLAGPARALMSQFERYIEEIWQRKMIAPTKINCKLYYIVIYEKSLSSLFVVLIPHWMKHSGQTSAHVRTLYWVRDVLSGFHNQVVSHELQKTTQLSKRVTFFYNRKVNKQDALTWISLVFDKTRILPLPSFGFFNRFH